MHGPTAGHELTLHAHQGVVTADHVPSPQVMSGSVLPLSFRLRLTAGEQNALPELVWAEDRAALDAAGPALPIDLLALVEGVIGGDVDGLGHRHVHVLGYHRQHSYVVVHVHFQCCDKGRIGDDLLPLRQHRLIEAVGVVADLDDLDVRLILSSHLDPAVILQGEDGLNAAGAVVAEGQGHGAGGRHGEELAIAEAVLQDLIVDGEPPVGVIPQ